MNQKNVVINLSNHPSTGWSREQKETLLKISNTTEIIDINFPYIDPYADESQIMDICFEYMSILNEYNFTYIHVMGEQTFCYILTNMLKENGKIVLVSTTQRVVEETDGKKIVYFNFVRFRQL